MGNSSLTKKQRQLIKELDELCSMFSLDYKDIEEYENDVRTILLEKTKNQIIRSQVIMWYTLVDEYLNVKLCHYFFGRKKSFTYLWRTKKFQTFNHHILEELSLMQKLRFVKTIIKFPKGIASDIERLNALRNGLAHAFFPENLKKSKPVWKGKSVFTLEGIKLLKEDMAKITEFFWYRSKDT